MHQKCHFGKKKCMTWLLKRPKHPSEGSLQPRTWSPSRSSEDPLQSQRTKLKTGLSRFEDQKQSNWAVYRGPDLPCQRWGGKAGFSWRCQGTTCNAFQKSIWGDRGGLRSALATGLWSWHLGRRCSSLNLMCTWCFDLLILMGFGRRDAGGRRRFLVTITSLVFSQPPPHPPAICRVWKLDFPDSADWLPACQWETTKGGRKEEGVSSCFHSVLETPSTEVVTAESWLWGEDEGRWCLTSAQIYVQTAVCTLHRHLIVSWFV